MNHTDNNEKQRMIQKNSFVKAWKRDISAYRQYRFNRSFLSEFDRRNMYIKNLIHAKGLFQIKQPFYCRYGSNISVGRDFICGHGAIFEDEGKIIIGDHVQMGNNVKLITTQVMKDPLLREKRKENSANIEIKHHAYIGHDVTILAGVTIGACAIIGDGSIVSEDVADGTMVCGNPAVKNEEASDYVKSLMNDEYLAMQEPTSWFERIANHVNLETVDLALQVMVLTATSYLCYQSLKELWEWKKEIEEKKAMVEKYIPLLDKMPQGKALLSKGKTFKKK